MLAVISPAKSMDTTPATLEVPAPSDPLFAARARKLAVRARQLKTAGLADLMNLSDDLAALNFQRFKTFGKQETKPAMLLFAGDVYRGLDAQSMSHEDMLLANDRLRILSGLYGLLRPLDAIEPYRLEMGTALANARGRNLYQFWGDAIAKHLNQWQASEAKPVLVNLASQEYFKAVDRKVLRARVVQCVFEDLKGGKYKVISFLAKRARGLMVRYAVTKQVTTVRGLQGFDLEGYRFDASVSDEQMLVFRRDAKP